MDEHENYPYIDKIITIADKYKLKYTINHHNYTGKNGLTGRYQKQFVQPNVIQLELKIYLRDFYSNPEIIAELTIPFLKDIIDTYQKIPD